MTWNAAVTVKLAFDQLDDMRRRRGAMLDLAGFGPVETRHRTLFSETGVSLRTYSENAGKGPAVLLIPAPIKRAYIWDLSPEISVVRRWLEKGMRVYLVDWMLASEAEQHFGLDDYGGRLLENCLDAVEADSRSSGVILAGHSLGGVLAASLACLHSPRVRAMVLLEAPLHFGADAGSFAPLVAATPDARAIGETFGNVPGSFLNLVSVTAAPHAFQWEPCLDWSQSMANPERLRTHMRVLRWAHDEFPLPGKFFSEVVELLYRDDQLMNGRLRIAGRTIGPADLKVPLLSVIDPRSTVIPPQSTLPFHEAAASREKKVLRYEGDVGVAIQHVGVLVGANAHATLWPAIFDWLNKQGLIH